VRLSSPDSRGVYSISVVSEFTGVQPAMLRVYEARGFLAPARTGGNTRRYSRNDVELIRRISALIASGLNFEGVRQVLELEEESDRLRSEVATLRDQLS